MHDTITHIKAWDEEHRRSIWKGPYSLDFFQEHAPSTGFVLDAGCGIGRYTLPLALRHYDMMGIDISVTAIKNLHHALLSRHLHAGLADADVRQLPFIDNIFDIVVCFGVLQHLFEEERQIALAEFHRILTPRGVLIMEVMGREDMRAGGRMVEPFTYLRSTGSIYHYFDVQELTRICSDFEIIDIKEEKNIKNLGGKECLRHMISIAARRNR